MPCIARASILRCALVMTVVFAGAAAAEDTARPWQRWEHHFVSSKDYSNPCVDVALHVRFDGPHGESRDGLGFWDGGAEFVIRCAFPTPGVWRWSTACSDESNLGLHARSGVVAVKPSHAESPLSRHGYVRVSGDGRVLAYADGTPFLWLGDTCWAAPVHASAREWKRYVTVRAKQGYSVLQLAIAPDWALESGRVVDAPFLSALPDITKPNPAFFQALDRKLALANDRGLAVMMCGLMETPHRYPPPEHVAVLSRYVAARYASFAVLFSPSFDSGIHEAETLASATAIREAAPSNLITLHMGTGVGPRFHSAEWLAFDMVQSGHNGGDAGRQSSRAIAMPMEARALAPRKPVVNGEAIYEGDLGGAYDVRRTAWLSFLSGAVGYTAGINEVYRWEEDAVAKMNVPSSAQAALLARILRALPWYSLEPASERITNQPDGRATQMAFAFTADRAAGLAYLPSNESIALNLSDCAPVYAVAWINASTGEWREGPAAASSPTTALRAPDNRDWVLLLSDPAGAIAAKVRTAIARSAYRTRKDAPTIAFGKDAPVNGLVQKSPGDGEWRYASFLGTNCIVNEKPKQNSYLYIDVDDRIAFRGNAHRMVVEVRLDSDGAPDGVQLQYDAYGPDDNANRYRSIAPSWRRQDGKWTTLGFTADSPYLGNRQNSGADFRLYFDGRRRHVASLKVKLECTTAATR